MTPGCRSSLMVETRYETKSMYVQDWNFPLGLGAERGARRDIEYDIQ